jgi:hypothetical protein
VKLFIVVLSVKVSEVRGCPEGNALGNREEQVVDLLFDVYDNLKTSCTIILDFPSQLRVV